MAVSGDIHTTVDYQDGLTSGYNNDLAEGNAYDLNDRTVGKEMPVISKDALEAGTSLTDFEYLKMEDSFQSLSDSASSDHAENFIERTERPDRDTWSADPLNTMEPYVEIPERNWSKAYENSSYPTDQVNGNPPDEKRSDRDTWSPDPLNTMEPYVEIPKTNWSKAYENSSYPTDQVNGNPPDENEFGENALLDEAVSTTKGFPNYSSVYRKQSKRSKLTSEAEKRISHGTKGTPSAISAINLQQQQNRIPQAESFEVEGSGQINTNQSNQAFVNVDAFGYIEDGYSTISKYREDKNEDSKLHREAEAPVLREQPSPRLDSGISRYSSCAQDCEITTSRQKVLRHGRVRLGTLDPRKLEDVTPSKCVNGCFENPWDTWREPAAGNAFKFFCMRKEGGLPSKEILDQTLPVLTLDYEKIRSPPPSGINVTWYGHATLLVQFDGVSILTDPIFSEFCGPTWLFSYKRIRPVPCDVHMLPHIDAVVISHSHYDHLDLPTVKSLNRIYGSTLRWFVPLGLKEWFRSTGIEDVIEMDWWQENSVPSHSDVTFAFTPAQHWSGRTPLDKNKSLWGSWSIIGPNHSFFFAGDTGYCEGFKEIGRRYGPFDVAAIPIGAYLPRYFLSPQHVDPEQAVEIHQDVRAMQSVGIHWGTFELGKESYLAPKNDLEIALAKKDLTESDFFTMKHGETRLLAAEVE